MERLVTAYITLQHSPWQSKPTGKHSRVLTSATAYVLLAMAPISISDRIKIIKGIDVAVPKGQGAVFANEEESAAVAAGSSVSFVGNLPAQMKVRVHSRVLVRVSQSMTLP